MEHRLDARVALAQSAQQLRHQAVHCSDRAVQADLSFQLFWLGVEPRAQAVPVVDTAAGIFQKDPPGIVEANPPVIALQQAPAELFLQAAQAAADRRGAPRTAPGCWG